MKEFRGFMFVMISAVIFGCMPLAAKVIYAEGCTSVSLVVYRYSISLPVLLVLALREQMKVLKQQPGRPVRSVGTAVYKQRVRALKRRMRLNPIQLRQMLVLSAGFCATTILLFSSYNYISSGSATTIHFSYPVFVILAGVVIFKEKLGAAGKAAVFFCVLGLICFYEPGQKGGAQGIFLALASGITYSFYMMYFDKSQLKFIRPFKMNFYLSAVSGVIAFLFAVFTDSFVLLHSARGWLFAAAFSFMITIVACILFQIGIADIGARKSAVLSTFEPITSVVLGAVLFHEAVVIKTWVGVLFIVVSVLSITVPARKRQMNRSD